MVKNLLLLLLVFFTSTAQAEDIDPKFFKDWLTLADLLQSKAITPSSPSWATIMPICLPLKKSTDESDYNRCLYRMAMDERQWQNDAKYCKEKAEKEYRDSLATRNAAPVLVTDSKGNKTIIEQDQINNNAYRDSYKDQNIYFKDCMLLGMGWNNTDSWTAGRRELPKQ